MSMPTYPTPVDTARRFIDAIVWGEHLIVWELLSPMARRAAIAIAERNGHDVLASARARNGTWTPQEADQLLGDLVRGLRVDLAAVDPAAILVGEATTLVGPTGLMATVELTVPSLLPPALTGGDDWAAGHIELVETDAGWLVERLVSRRAQKG